MVVVIATVRAGNHDPWLVIDAFFLFSLVTCVQCCASAAVYVQLRYDVGVVAWCAVHDGKVLKQAHL